MRLAVKGRQGRRAASAVEFAVVAPLLFLLFVGAIEFGRAVMSLELLSHTARHGARTGVLPHRSTADIQAAVGKSLEEVGLNKNDATVTVTVNGATQDARTALSGDEIKVTVAVPFDKLSWLPASWFIGDQPLSQSVVMRREG